MKPVSKTAFYCCGVRMQDAESAKPLIGDNYAKRLLGAEGAAYWNIFKKLKYPNASNVARHHTIDCQLKDMLALNPDATIIIIGCGLDSRPYRFDTGHWIELDEPAIIKYKDEVLPVEECKNKLQRIAIDFQQEKLSDKLAPFQHHNRVVIVIEGVLMYLSHTQKIQMIHALTSTFRKHTLLCDLMRKNFFKIVGGRIHRKLADAGSRFTDLSNTPEAIFIDNGYHNVTTTSNILTAADAGLIKIPKFMLNAGPVRSFLMGYSVYRFDFGK
jgi:methyltransferase (TIGR00027 family)